MMMRQNSPSTKKKHSIYGCMATILGITLLLSFLLNVYLLQKRNYTVQNNDAISAPLNDSIAIKNIELAIGIISVPRLNNEDYIFRTISAINREIQAYSPSTNTENIFLKRVIVFNPRQPGSHREFARTKDKFQSSTFHFIERNVVNETIQNLKDAIPGVLRKMKAVDLQQNIDASAMFGAVYDDFCTLRPHGFVMIMEDDFELCPFALHHLHRAIHAAENFYFPNFTALRVSMGFSGIVLQCHDMPVFRDHLFYNMHIGPADAMMGAFWTKWDTHAGHKYFGPNRRYAVYRHNIMEHIGDFSAILQGQVDRTWPKCYDDLFFSGLTTIDRFDFHNCGTKEFSPCDIPSMGDSMLTMLRGNAEFDPSFQMHELATKIFITNGSRGEDCHTTCENMGMTCARYMFPIINTCKMLEQYFDCKACTDHTYIIPNRASRSPARWEDGTCYESHIFSDMRCEGADDRMERLCACATLLSKRQPKRCIAQDSVPARKGPCDHWSTVERLNKYDIVQPIAEKEGCGNWWVQISNSNKWVEKKHIIDCPDGISKEQFDIIVRGDRTIPTESYLSHLNAAMIEAEITTCLRRAAFFGQLSYESGFKYMEQLSSGEEYEDRKDFGNTEPGDGKRFKGRGPAQIKGRGNYRAAGIALGVDLENNPNLVSTTAIGFRTAAWFWKDRNLNKFADMGSQTGYDEITKIFEKDMYGKPERDKGWEHAMSVLSCTNERKNIAQ